MFAAAVAIANYYSGTVHCTVDVSFFANGLKSWSESSSKRHYCDYSITVVLSQLPKQWQQQPKRQQQ